MKIHDYIYKVEQKDGSFIEYKDFANTKTTSVSFKGESGQHEVTNQTQTNADLKITKKIDTSKWSKEDVEALKTGKPGKLLFDKPKKTGVAIQVLGITLMFFPLTGTLVFMLIATITASPMAIILGITILAVVFVVLSVTLLILAALDYTETKKLGVI